MKYFVRTLMILVGIALATVLAEVVFRVAITASPAPAEENQILEVIPDSNREYGYRPNNELLNTNSLGFRGAEPDFEIGENIVRIVMLGDSITAGNGIVWDETVTYRLADRLNGSSGEKTFKTYNLGVTGYNTVQELVTLKEVGVRFMPDLVVLNVCFNDSDPVSEVFKTGLARSAVIESFSDINLRTIVASSYVLSLLKYGVLKFIKDTNPRVFTLLNNPNAFIDVRVTETAWSRMKDTMLEIRDVTDEHNAKFLVVLYPYASQLPVPENQLRPQNDLAEFLNLNNIEFLDLTPAYKTAQDNMYIDETIHVSAYGAARSAEAIAERILGKFYRSDKGVD